MKEIYKKELIKIAGKIVVPTGARPEPNWMGHYNIFLRHPSGDELMYVRVLYYANSKFKCQVLKKIDKLDPGKEVGNTIDIDPDSLESYDIICIIKDGTYRFTGDQMGIFWKFQHIPFYRKFSKRNNERVISPFDAAVASADDMKYAFGGKIKSLVSAILSKGQFVTIVILMVLGLLLQIPGAAESSMHLWISYHQNK